MGKGRRYPHIVAILKRFSSPGDRVLELGCGGAVYKDLFKNYIGLDLPMNPYEHPGDALVYALAEKLPFKEDTFNLVFAVAVLHLITEVETLLTEVYRVLNKGGCLLIFDYNLKTLTRLKRLNQAHHLWTPEQLKALVEQAGFRSRNIINYNSWKSNSYRDRFRLSLPFWLFISWVRKFRESWNIVLGEKG
jgi:SAM-dependent methyltransferase